MYKVSVITVFLLIIASISAHEETEESIQYSTDKFKESVPKKNHFVMFYAPWCDHCKRLAPAWNELSKKFKTKENADVAIVKVDCTVETALCSEHDVTGYPTLKFFKVGEDEGLKFRGSRDLSSLTSFVYEQIGKEDDDSDVPDLSKDDDKLFELGDYTFHDHIEKGKHFVKFYAPWCGHCQKLAPTWEELAKSLKDNKVTICKVDCTMHRAICNEFEVKGYPTMLWFEDGKKTEKYQGSRTLGDLQEFVDRMSAVADDKDDSEGKGEEEDTASNPVLVLSGPTFEHGTSTGLSFVKFFAPWCGHCKRLAPTWDELALKLLSEQNVRVAKVDCTLPENKELCNTQEVDGFPTIFLYRDGTKISEYNGSRSLDDLLQYIRKYIDELKSKDEL